MAKYAEIDISLDENFEITNNNIQILLQLWNKLHPNAVSLMNSLQYYAI